VLGRSFRLYVGRVDTQRFLVCGAMAIMATLTGGCGASGGDSSRRSEADPPDGKLAIGLATGRGFRITDLQGNDLRKIAVPPGEAVPKVAEAGGVGVAFSADGDELWFLTAAGTTGQTRYRLHIHPTSGRGSGTSSPVVLGDVAGYPLLVSPHGDRVAIGGAAAGHCGSAAVIIGRNGQRMRAFSGAGSVGVALLSWSPDGSRLLYALNRWPDPCGKFEPDQAVLMVHATATGADQRIAFARGATFKGSAWSRDGRRIALSRCKSSEDWDCRLIMVGANGGALHALGDVRTLPSRLVWAVKTNEIVTSGPHATDDPGIWAVNAASGRTRTIEEFGDSVLGASGDASRLVISRAQSREYGILDVASGEFSALPAIAQRKTRLGTAIPAEASFIADPEGQ
jgi:hypothetical protein